MHTQPQASPSYHPTLSFLNDIRAAVGRYDFFRSVSRFLRRMGEPEHRLVLGMRARVISTRFGIPRLEEEAGMGEEAGGGEGAETGEDVCGGKEDAHTALIHCDEPLQLYLPLRCLPPPFLPHPPSPPPPPAPD